MEFDRYWGFGAGNIQVCVGWSISASSRSRSRKSTLFTTLLVCIPYSRGLDGDSGESGVWACCNDQRFTPTLSIQLPALQSPLLHPALKVDPALCSSHVRHHGYQVSAQVPKYRKKETHPTTSPIQHSGGTGLPCAFPRPADPPVPP